MPDRQSPRDVIEMRAPVYHVFMRGTGVPDLLFRSHEYGRAFEAATGETAAGVDDEHPEEWRISIIDFEGTREVPVADV